MYKLRLLGWILSSVNKKETWSKHIFFFSLRKTSEQCTRVIQTDSAKQCCHWDNHYLTLPVWALSSKTGVTTVPIDPLCHHSDKHTCILSEIWSRHVNLVLTSLFLRGPYYSSFKNKRPTNSLCNFPDVLGQRYFQSGRERCGGPVPKAPVPSHSWGSQTTRCPRIVQWPIYECRCDERIQTKVKEFTRLTYTGLIGGLEHLKIETRLINEKIANALGEYVT